MTTQHHLDGASGPRQIRSDVPAGILFMVFGAAGLFLSRKMDIGTAAAIGSGFVPMLACTLLVLFGLIVLLQGLRQRGETTSITSLWPLILVTICVLVFSFTLERFGLVLATMLTVFISTFAGEKPRIVQSLALGAVLSFVCVAIFIWGAKLPIQAWFF